MSKLVFVRHGKSEWNKLNKFTGWVDVPLASEGFKEAKKAGEIIKDLNFDFVFTSHLQRAIVTMQIILNESKSNKTPIFIPKIDHFPKQNYICSEKEIPAFIHIKELAERHYGDLQGKNKDQILKEVGEEQFLKWRRGYDTPPPNGESLKDTYNRSVPYFLNEIMPLLKNSKDVMIVAHGNSLRALTKYIENISDEDIVNLEIKTGTPIIYDLDFDMDKMIIKNKIIKNVAE